MKTDSPEPRDLLKQVIDAAPHFGQPRGMLSRDTQVRRPDCSLVVLLSHER
ncbi:MAG TPA: hypothetical protein VIJ82_19240 [Streptosporangiaceae bacterium]